MTGKKRGASHESVDAGTLLVTPNVAVFLTVVYGLPLHCELSFGLLTSIIPWTSMDFHDSKNAL